QKHARWLEEAMYILWKQGARVVIGLQTRDSSYNGRPGRGNLQTGIAFASDFRNGKRKPAFRAWRFPFVTERRTRRVVRAWGKAPVGGTLQIQVKRKGGWRTLKRRSVKAGSVFT